MLKTTRRIACICAYPRNANYGMFSVDLAIGGFLRAANIETAELTRFTCEGPLQVSCGDGFELCYEQLKDPAEQLKNFDLVVIWGDFITSRVYLEEVSALVARANDVPLDAARDQVYRCLLLEGAPESLLAKSMVLSSNLLPNDSFIDDQRYQDAVRRLYSNALAVCPRDPISASIAKIYSGRFDNVGMGVDAAFFLEHGPNFSPVRSERRPGYVGYYFSRSSKLSRRTFHSHLLSRFFVKRLASLFGLECKALSWHSKAARGGEERGFGTALAELRDCRYVVTDTYHCAINAWREGTPAICLGRGVGYQGGSLDDKKKELLYLAMMAQPFYIFSDAIAHAVSTHRAARALSSPGTVNAVLSNLEVQKRTYAEFVNARLTTAARSLDAA